MFVKQISVFVENKPGRILDIMETLSQNSINISALSVADTSEFGIARMIVSDAELAKKVLKETGVFVKINDVIVIAVADKPGGLTSALRILKDSDIVIEYMYASAEKLDDNSLIVIRTDKPDDAANALARGGVKVLSQKEVNTLRILRS